MWIHDAWHHHAYDDISIALTLYNMFTFSADDDELTFDPGEKITNIEFVSALLFMLEFPFCKIQINIHVPWL